MYTLLHFILVKQFNDKFNTLILKGYLMAERTLSIIKPDATKRHLIGKIISKFEEEKFEILAIKTKKLTQVEAQGFYAEHKDRPFFGELVDFMTSGPVVLMVLQKDDAVQQNRTLMGATNPADAAQGTIRKEFALSLGMNSVHGH